MDLVAGEEHRVNLDNASVTTSDNSRPAPPNDSEQAGSGETKFQSAISAWRNIDLTKLVPELDGTANDILSYQRDSLVSRKELAQKTKDFRKADDATKLVDIKTLLKSYQTFIDLLTNHSKTTSSAFLRVYSSLSEAPDPYPLLEASVEALLTTEDTLPKLTTENEHLQEQVSSLTQQLDTRDSELEQERAARKQLEATRDSKIQEVETSWKAVIEEKQDNWEAKEKSLEEKVESQEKLLSELKASYEVSQRLKDGGSEETSGNVASAAELEIVSSDLERTSQRLAEVEARNEQLRLELAQSTSNTRQQSVKEEDPVNVQLRLENSSLLRKIENAKLQKQSDDRKQDGRIRSLEKEAQNAEQDRKTLREKLSQWRDYPEIKQELEIFKSIEFSTLDDDETSQSLQDTKKESGPVKGSKSESLEQMLLARNKKLGNEMAVLRVSHQDLQKQLGSLQESLSTTKDELDRSRDLNATLEGDLLKVQQEASNAFPSSAMSTTGTYTSRAPTSYNANSFRNKGRTSPTSSIISGFDPQAQSRNTMEAIRAGEAVGGGSGILPMIQAQRDRFKQKNSQLEKDLSEQYNIVSSLRQEVASLQKDNLNLYEKSRYVSTYSRGGNTSSASAYAPPTQNSSTIATISSDSSSPSGLSLDRYRSTYEANLSPFAAFRGRESSRAFRRMSLPERVVYSLTRFLLATRARRNLFAIYCFALHFLIFIMLLRMGGGSSAQSVVGLGVNAGAGAAAAGGGGGGTGSGSSGSRNWKEEGFIADPDH